MATATRTQFVRAAALEDVTARGCMAVQVEGHTVALYAHQGQVYAVDNRCPHMGFPLDRGTVRDGILTCHWHHARFDLNSGGTFDQWADDVRVFPVEVRDGAVWIDLAPRHDPQEHYRQRLRIGLERNISLVIAKSALALLDADDPGSAVAPFRIGLEFGTTYRRAGWGQGLTILACMMNLLPHLNPDDRPRALYQGLTATASDTAGAAPRFGVRPLPLNETDIPTLKRWFRQFIEVRDDEGAERCVISAIESGADARQLADMLFAAATDHRYIQIGHPLDFTNKAFDALDIVGWQHADTVLTSLVRAYAVADRMEESTAWRYPLDLIAILDETFDALPGALAAGQSRRGSWQPDHESFVAVLLGDDPQAIATLLLDALRAGATEDDIAGLVSYAAALRIARFHTSNEFGDWDTALHTFTFANAVQMGLRRIESPLGEDAYIPLLRGVFDAAMSVYLDRFLNIPAARLPQPNGDSAAPAALLKGFPALLDRQQQVNEAAKLVAEYLAQDGDADSLRAALGAALLREDRDFHTIQTIEAAFNQYDLLRDGEAGAHVLIAAARYLAAHAPTVRAQEQTYTIADRLRRGAKLFEED